MQSPNFQKYTNEQQNLPARREFTEIISQENPFDNEKYNDVKFPDAPLGFGSNMVDSLLNNDEVPEEVKEKYWFIFHKDNVLTFLDEERQQKKLNSFDIMKIDMLNSMPYYDYTFDQEKEFNVLRTILETKLDRSRGIQGGNIKNERTMLQSQFSENRNINESSNSGPIKEGFFKRLMGRR